MSMTSSFVSICSWNVGSLFSKTLNKVNQSDFCNELLSYDIVFLFETHTDYETRISLDNIFQYEGLYHQITGTLGGLPILIRNSIRHGVKVLKNTNGLKYTKTFFQLEKDIFMCFSYISLCSFQIKADTDTIDDILKDINSFRNIRNIVLCGDLNARTGSELNFILDDTDKYIHLDLNILLIEILKT